MYGHAGNARLVDRRDAEQTFRPKTEFSGKVCRLGGAENRGPCTPVDIDAKEAGLNRATDGNLDNEQHRGRSLLSCGILSEWPGIAERAAAIGDCERETDVRLHPVFQREGPGADQESATRRRHIGTRRSPTECSTPRNWRRS